MTETAPKIVSITLALLIICFAACNPASAQTDDNKGKVLNDATRSHASITERFLGKMREPVGFSIGVFELSAPDLRPSGSQIKPVLFTMLRPEVFANTKTPRSQLQFDYAFGYRGYNGDARIHSSDHLASADFEYRLSRKVLFQISDTFRSVFNDYSFLPDSPSRLMYQPNFAQAIYVPNERTTTNSLVAGINYPVNRKIGLTMFGGYDVWRYTQTSFGNAQGVDVGVRVEYRVNKWLFLDNSYSHYLNAVVSAFRPSDIHRLQVGGFTFRLRRSVELHLSGGIDSTHLQGSQLTVAGVQAGISKTSVSTALNVFYQRGLYLGVGPQAIFNGDIIGASLNRWLYRTVNLHLNSGYNRGSAIGKDSKLEYLSANSGFEIAVQRHVLFSAQSSYIWQHGTSLPLDAPVLNGQTISTGLQFFFSSLTGQGGARR